MTETKTSFTMESLAELTAPHPAPCVSLYQETHRRYPESQQDPVRFHNLVKNLQFLLHQKYPTLDVKQFMEPMEALAKDLAFWGRTLDGIAVFASANFFRVFKLQASVGESSVVAESFHLTPLRRYLQTVGRYQVLGLGKEKIRLFEGNLNVLDEIVPKSGVPRTMADVVGDESDDALSTVVAYGKVGKGNVSTRHSVGSKRDEAKVDEQKFFRSVDRAILEHYSRLSGLPLILACLPEHQHLFHEVSHNPFLMAEGIHINPEIVSIDDLQKMARTIMQVQAAQKQATLVADFGEAQAKGLGSTNMEHVTAAASEGRVASLMLKADSPGTNLIGLDALADLVEKDGGQVSVLPVDAMPGTSGLAAIYRY